MNFLASTLTNGEHVQAALQGKGDKNKHPKPNKPAAHPSAPAGGGGPGQFRDAGCIGGSGAAADCVKPPAARTAAPTAAPAGAKPNPPPATVTSKEILKQDSGPNREIEIYLQVLSDDRGSTAEAEGADTDFIFDDVHADIPSYSTDGHKVTSLNGKFEFKGTIKIKTTYGPGAKATDPSAYGRGTTPEDEKNGDTTLGFHESCHRADYLTYLKTNPLPDFTGKIGDKESVYKSAQQKFGTDYEKYKTNMKADSRKNTDEVGYKRSTFLKRGPRQ